MKCMLMMVCMFIYCLYNIHNILFLEEVEEEDGG